MVIYCSARGSNKQTMALELMMREIAWHIARKRIKATRNHIRRK